jgi:hypothetical protein
VTGDTILDIADAFFSMFRSHVAARVLMTAITPVLAVAITGMTHPASDIVVSIQHKNPVVIKFRGYPVLRAVAGHAIALDKLLVERTLHVSPWQHRAVGCAQTNASQYMASNASLRIGAAPSGMTGKTVRRC